MKIAGIIEDDFVDCDDGVCVSLWTSGCPHKCKGCHNQSYWDYNSGTELSLEEIKEKIIKAIGKNGIKRHFSILGGEPLAPYNIKNVLDIIKNIREEYPEIKIYLWTGYTLGEVENFPILKEEKLANLVDYLIDGKYIEELRDTSLKLRGSKNQTVWKSKNGQFVVGDKNLV